MTNVYFLCWVVQIYAIICIVRVAMSWLNLDEGGGILVSVAQISYVLTEPVFQMVRRRLPQIGDLPIDFSPAIILLVLGVLRSFLCGLA